MSYIIYSTNEKVKLPPRGYFTKGDKGNDILIISTFLACNFLGFEFKTKVKVENILGNYLGNNLISWIKEFQKCTGLVADGNIGSKTLAKLREYGLDG